MDTAEIREHVINVIEAGKQIFIFSTVDQEGRPHSRYMGTLNIHDDYSTFYMACKASSSKLQQIRGNPNVQVLFVTPDYMEVATLSGKAYPEDSDEIKKETWEKNPAMAGYFASAEAPDYAIIRFEPELAEYYCSSKNYEAETIPWGAATPAKGKKTAR